MFSTKYSCRMEMEASCRLEQTNTIIDYEVFLNFSIKKRMAAVTELLQGRPSPPPCPAVSCILLLHPGWGAPGTVNTKLLSGLTSKFVPVFRFCLLQVQLTAVFLWSGSVFCDSAHGIVTKANRLLCPALVSTVQQTLELPERGQWRPRR